MESTSSPSIKQCNPWAPFSLLRFHMKTLSVLALHSHCSAMKTKLFENANENGAFWKRSVFSVSTKNGDLWKRFTFLCWKAIENNGIMAFKFAISAFMAAANKRYCFEKGINNTVLLEQCECHCFHSVFIWKRSNVGHGFHPQKRIETKTEQCERGLTNNPGVKSQ